MDKYLDFVLLMLLTVSGLVAFIKLITIGDVALGTCGIVAFILFGLAIFRRGNEED
jgi:hypothetical protein